MAATVIAFELNAASIAGSVFWSFAIWHGSKGGNSFGFFGVIFYVGYSIVFALQCVFSLLPSLIVAGSGSSLTPTLIHWVRRTAFLGLVLTAVGFAAVFVGLLTRPPSHSPT